MKKSVILALIALVICVQVDAEEENRALDVRTTGYFIWDGGYLNEGKDIGGVTYESTVFGDLMGGVVLTVNPSDRLSLRINPELKSYYPFPREFGAYEQVTNAKWQVYMEEARADWAFGDPSKPSFTAGLGYMIYKENPDARIFGDYLHRSLIYPGILTTKFNYPQTQVFGLHLGQALGEGFKHDFFLLSETKYYPYFDLSLAYSASYSFKNMVEVGAGVNLKNLIPVRPSLTSPNVRSGGNNTNVYFEVPPQVITLSPDSIVTIVAAGPDSTDVIIRNSLGVVVSPADSARIPGHGVTGFLQGELSQPLLGLFMDATNHYLPQVQGGIEEAYTFAGTLITARIAVNLLAILGQNPLGKDALKVYLEGAVLGWKNYAGFYADRRERIPIMGGVYLPTMNFLDFLSLEAEYYPYPHYPSRHMRAEYHVPISAAKKQNQDWADKTKADNLAKKDDWKWGIAAKKSFKGFALVAQVGTDHSKLPDVTGIDHHDVMIRPAHWYFQFRFIGGVY